MFGDVWRRYGKIAEDVELGARPRNVQAPQMRTEVGVRYGWAFPLLPLKGTGYAGYA